MGLISPGGENLLDFLDLRQVLSTYDRNLGDPLWWPQERPVKIQDSTGEGETSQEAPEQLAWGRAFTEAIRAGPKGPVISREHLLQLEKIQEVLPSRRDDAHFR